MRIKKRTSRWPRVFLQGCLIAVIFFAVPFIAHAQEATGFARALGLPANDARLIVLRLLQIIWVITTIIGIAFDIFGFVRLRRAREDEDLAEEASAKRFLILGTLTAVIGLVLFGAITFIYSRFAQSYVAQPPSTFSPTDISQPVYFGEYQSRQSRIESHYPARDEKNVPRNAKILITFRESIRAHSVRSEDGSLLSASVRIHQISPTPTPDGQGVLAEVSLTDDEKSIVIAPVQLLGMPDTQSLYGISLTSAILSKNGESLFGNTGGYSWQFQVSGVVDNDPPRVTHVFPAIGNADQESTVARNALVQISFSEALDPSLVSGEKISVQNLETGASVPGTILVGNQYRTVTFVPRELCGTNSCRESIYCFPEKGGRYQVSVRAASLADQRTAENPHRASYPYDGIADAAGNSLDGGGRNGSERNDKADGPPADNFVWSFTITQNLDSTPPAIESVSPSRDSTKVDVSTPIDITFSKYMDLNSLHQGSIYLGIDGSYWVESEQSATSTRTRARLRHDPLQKDTLYQPEVRASARDVFQNCFNPCVGPSPRP
ncbi:Ig-like domain-containing protein [Candidatus Uhrbacteria bacterium]|nr:Ig-like domain-containing protein [Candidatus Uhrbacteria bacterium]